MYQTVHHAVTMLHGDGKQNPRNLRVQPLPGGDELLSFDLVHDGVDQGPKKPNITCRIAIPNPDLMDPMDWNRISATLMRLADEGRREIDLDARTSLLGLIC